ncbi:MAG TPA: PQQ-binding-like beta-propeller repeat protein [Rhizomicrobium sp.]|jgi:quinoprotein glucose dehydrogenase
MKLSSVLALLLLGTAPFALPSISLGAATGPGDWPGVGNDPGGSKFSTLSQITPANVTQLKKAWTYDTGEPSGGFRGWEVTPIVVNNLMYFPTSKGKIVALHADTGAEAWKVDLTTLGVKGAGAKYGVSYWPGQSKTAPRIVVATKDGYLLQLDAKTGALYKKFGENGLVDLKAGVMEKFGGPYTPGATPAIYKNIAILSPTSGEQGRYGVPGDPRAFDLITGKELWRFHTVPRPGEANFGDWGLNGWQDRRGPGSWVPMTVDTQRGIVYIALGNATDQNYGGNRPGNNTYATSVIALDAVTGKLKWHWAITHHDIFDWDVNAPPTLVDVRKDGKVIPAVAQSTKVGYLWILNRETGEPVFGSEERPVPGSDAPGEVASHTQPFPLKPGPISRVSMTRDEVSDVSPGGKAACQKLYDTAVNAGPHTPYLTVPSLVFPSSEGGGSWSGASYDPGQDIIYVNTRSLGTMGRLMPSKSSNLFDSYAKQKLSFDDSQGYPCSAAPWGELMAIDANTADVKWRVPLGEYKELTARGIPKTGTPNAGGPIITASGLLFIGATADRMFRAFDARTGKELWSVELPNNSVDTPMTYRGMNGKQYVAAVISSGLDNFNIPKLAGPGTDKIITFTLP